jgi:RHS repeat-associated protein
LLLIFSAYRCQSVHIIRLANDVGVTPNPLNTYSNNYKYIPETHKVKSIIDGNASGTQQLFAYDENGNTIEHVDEYGSKHMFWDEQDRLKAFYSDDSGVYQYYAYNDKGERTIKYNLHGSSQLYQNGELVDPGSLSLTDYTLYPNPYVTVSLNGQYTKHYFEGTTRFASRVQNGSNIFIPLNVLRTSDQDTTLKEPNPEADFKTYLEKAGIGNVTVSELNTLNGPTSQIGLYYLHGDHLGTANYVTNAVGQTTQFFLNLPFGETMLEQQTGVYDNPYKFNAKELDKETGLYYYGARYFNPRASIWYGVDPLAVYHPVAETQFYGDGQHNGGVYFWGNLNPYIYTYQNPIKYIDPNGKQVNTTASQDMDNAESVISMAFGVIGDARAGVLNLVSRARGTDDRFKGDGFTGYYRVPKENAQGVFWDFFNLSLGVLSARYGVSSNTLLSVKQGTGNLRQLREVIESTKALGKYSKFGECVGFADSFKKAFGGTIKEIDLRKEGFDLIGGIGGK